MAKNYEIDNVDLKILTELMKDAKVPYTEIAKKVYVSGGTVHVRMKKLEEMGVVTGTTLSMDYSNYNIFIKIHCRDTKHLKDVLHDKIQKVEGIERTETFISLEESLNRHIQLDV